MELIETMLTIVFKSMFDNFFDLNLYVPLFPAKCKRNLGDLKCSRSEVLLNKDTVTCNK